MFVADALDAEQARRFSPDGRWVVAAGPGKAGIWNAETGALL